MKIHIEYTGQIKAAIDRADETIEMPTGASLEEVVRQIASAHGPKASRILLDGDGVHRALILIINDEQVTGGSSPALADGDRLTIMPPISGG